MDQAVGSYGWTTCAVKVPRHRYPDVLTMAGLIIIVVIVKTCPYRAAHLLYDTVI